MAISFLFEAGSEIGELVKQRVVQKVYDALTNENNDRGSISSQGGANIIHIPFISTKDIPMDTVSQTAKSTEIKFAMDIKMYLESCINADANSVQLHHVMHNLPITIVGRGGRGNNAAISDMLRDRFNASVSDAIGMHQESLNSINDFVKDFALVDCCKVSLVSEAATGTPVFSDRNALPTYVRASIRYITGRGEIKDVEFTIGVQCSARYVDEDELMTRICNYDNKDFYRKFVLLERGEVNFITDLMLDLKNVVASSRSAARGKDDIFNMMDRHHMLKEFGVHIYPYLTFLVSNEFVERALKQNNMDIHTDINTIMKTFMALGFYIYYPEMDKVRIFYDGDRHWNEVLFSDLARDTAKWERELKNLIKLKQ